jgi:hypothetical protein
MTIVQPESGMRFAFALCTVVAAGCQAEVIDPVETPKADAGAAAYPEGPYGYTVGSVIADLQFVGRTDSNGDGALDDADGISTIALGDYRADADVRAIAVDVCAMWCGPCQDEQAGLIQMSNTYGAPVRFLEAIQQSPSLEPAELRHVDAWAESHGISFDLVIDPTDQLAPYFPIAAFPTEMVIRTSDMTIAYQHSGTDNAALQAAIDAVLAE